MVDESVKENSQSPNLNSNTFIHLIENSLGIDQRFILKAVNITCLLLALFSLSMSYIAYKYNELLHMKLLLILTIMLIIFSGMVFWYVPKLEGFLRESNKTEPEKSSTRSKAD